MGGISLGVMLCLRILMANLAASSPCSKGDTEIATIPPSVTKKPQHPMPGSLEYFLVHSIIFLGLMVLVFFEESFLMVW